MSYEKNDETPNRFILKKVFKSSNTRYDEDARSSVSYPKSISQNYIDISRSSRSKFGQESYKSNNSSQPSLEKSIYLIKGDDDKVEQGIDDCLDSKIVLKKVDMNILAQINKLSQTEKSEAFDMSNIDNDKSNNLNKSNIKIMRTLSKSPTINKRQRLVLKKPELFANDLLRDKENYSDRSLFIFPKSSRFRLLMFKIVCHRTFDYFILTAILINSLILGLDMSLGLNTPGKFDLFDFLEWFFYAIFAAESLVKITAWGFWSGKKSYIKDPTNIVDFLVVSLSIWKLIPSLKPYKEFNVFRLLRPLRSISFIPGLKKIVTIILNSVKQLINLFLLMLFIFLFFGLFGVTIWAGLFSLRCREQEFPINGQWDVINNSTDLCSGHYICPNNYTCGSITELYDSGQYFFIPKTNVYKELDIQQLYYGFSTFDNIFSSFLTIFQCATLSNWTAIMYNIQNGYSYYAATLYFVTLIIVLSYFIMNFTIAIMMDNCYKYEYHKDVIRKVEKKESNENDNVQNRFWQKTQAFIEFLKKIRFCTKVTPIYDCHNKYKICYYAYVISEQPIFNMIVYMFTVSYLIILALVTDDEKSVNESTLNIFSYTVTLVYTFECCIKILGIGFKKYFTTGMDIFDFIVLTVSFFEIILQIRYVAVLKIIRVYRVSHLFSEWKTIAIIIKCITETLKEMGYYIFLLLILIYVLALIGISFFKGKLYFKNGDFDFSGQIPDTNYENVYQAAIAVFALLIGDNWQDLLFMTLRSPLTNKILCYAYFITNVILLNIIMMNLVIAFLVNNFKKARHKYTYQEYMYNFLEERRHLGIKRSSSSTNLKIFKLKSYFEVVTVTMDKGRRKSSLKVDDIITMAKHGFDLKPDAEIAVKIVPDQSFIIKPIGLSINKMYENPEFKTHIEVEEKINARKSHFIKKTSNLASILKKPFGLVRQRTAEAVRFNNYLDKNNILKKEPSRQISKLDNGPKNIVELQTYDYLNLAMNYKAENISHEKDITKWGRMKKYFANSSLFIFHINCKIRRLCIWLVRKKRYEYTVIMIIICSCIVLLLDNDYIDPNSTYSKVLSIFDDVFSILFFIEMLLKIIAYGFIFDQKKEIRPNEEELMDFSNVTQDRRLSSYTARSPARQKNSLKDIIEMNDISTHPPKIERKATNLCGLKEIPEKFMERAYLRTLFNVVDCGIVLTSLAYVIYKRVDVNFFQNSYSLAKSFSTLKSLRALRPLRMINKFQELKVVVNCLILSTNAIINMYIIGLFVIFIYGIVGLNLFKGTLGKCTLSDYSTHVLCKEAGGIWKPSDRNFDSISSALLVLFELSTTSGWLDVMHNVMISNGQWVSVYFISFMLIGCIFVMNLGITVIVDNFNSLNERAENISLLSESQKDYLFGLRYIMNYKPIPHISIIGMRKFRLFCHKIYSWKWTSRIINILIIINVVVMCMRFDRYSYGIEDIQSYIFYFSTFMFNIEIFLGIITYRRFYFIDGWNKFDFVVIILCNLSLVLTVIRHFVYKNLFLGKFSIINVLIRGIRILRVIRLINLNKQVKDYFYTIISLFPSLYNIGSLVLIMLIVFSIIGMNLFGTVMYDNTINTNNNFKDIISSFVFLIKITSGDNWGDSMYSLGNNQLNCVNVQAYDDLMRNGPQGCGSWVAFPFFIIFLLLNKLVVMNLFIAVVVDTFISKTVKSDKIDDTKIQKFFELWGKYDRMINYYIKPNEFVLLMLELEYPLGLNGDRLWDMEYNKQRIFVGEVHISFSNKYFADDRQCVRILDNLNVVSRDDKIYLIDAITVVIQRALFKNSIPHEALDSIRKYKRLSRKIDNHFHKYDKNYKEVIKTEPKISSKLIAMKVILKYVKRWRDKTRQSIFNRIN
jgi:hypothetical protein